MIKASDKFIKNNVAQTPLENPLDKFYGRIDYDLSEGEKNLRPNPLPITYNEAVKQQNEVVPQTFIQKNKNDLLIAGAIVLGYFAYKKFKM